MLLIGIVSLFSGQWSGGLGATRPAHATAGAVSKSFAIGAQSGKAFLGNVANAVGLDPRQLGVEQQARSPPSRSQPPTLQPPSHSQPLAAATPSHSQPLSHRPSLSFTGGGLGGSEGNVREPLRPRRPPLALLTEPWPLLLARYARVDEHAPRA